MSSATQYAIPSKFGGKWETEYLYPRPTLLRVEYSVKLILLIYFMIIFLDRYGAVERVGFSQSSKLSAAFRFSSPTLYNLTLYILLKLLNNPFPRP